MLHDNAGYGVAIGGRCDLTTISASGVHTETVREWDDRIGEKVQPYGRNVASIATAANRQQRRAAERISKKGHAA
jgi:hypothetical protein